MERDKAFFERKYFNAFPPKTYRDMDDIPEENNIIGPSPEQPDFDLLREFNDTRPQVRFSQPFLPLGPNVTSVSNTLPPSILVNPPVNPLLSFINGQISQKAGENTQGKINPLNFKEWNSLFNQFFPRQVRIKMCFSP